MARSLEARLARLEAYTYDRRMRTIDATAAQYGITSDDLIEEARVFFALSLAEQLADIDQHEAILCAEGFTNADLADMRQTLTRYYRPMD